MADVRYVFGDAVTGTVIEEIACSGVSIDDSLDGGEFRGTFGMDQTGKSNEDLAAATIPGRCYVVVERGNVVIWGGLVWSRTYQSQAKSVQLYAKTFDAYTTKRVIDTNMSFVATEQRNVFRSLYETMQSDPDALAVDLPATFGDIILIDLEVSGSELKTYRSVLDQIANTETGFEWRIDVARAGSNYTRTLRIGYPTIGTPQSTDNVVFEYPGNILNYWRTDTIGPSGTNIFGAGAGEGQSMNVVEVIHDDLLNNGFARYDQTISFKDVSDADVLEQMTQKQAALRKAPMGIYTVEMKGDREPEFGSWSVGDFSRLSIRDPMHKAGSLDVARRIVAFTYNPPEGDNAEEVRLTFEGDDAGE